MHPLKYYEFTFRSSISKKKNPDNWNGTSIYSKVSYDSPEYVGQKLFFPANNEQYSAYQRLPLEKLSFMIT
ncbi:MAG: hypothetical protein ACRBFS_22680 [Aureispira sp.]